MTTRFITTNQQIVNTANGDNTFIAQGVTVNDGIDMRGNGGGSQTVTVYGTLFGSIDDYFNTTSGRDQIFIGATGSVNTYWFGAVNLAGGGNIIVNAGTISAMSYGNAIQIYAYGNTGSYQTERNYITNTGTISSTSLHPERTWTDATIYTAVPGGVTITNTGSILSSIGYAMALSEADDSVTNSGFIQGGVFLGDGNDFFDSRQGTITGPILGYAGNDTIYGSKGDDTIVGGDGTDRIDGYLGADVMIGGDSNDTYFVDDPGDVVEKTMRLMAAAVSRTGSFFRSVLISSATRR